MRQNGESILDCHKEHHAKPKQGLEEWDEAIAYTNSEKYGFDATKMCWLENRFFTLASDVNRYNTMNGNEPNTGNPSEETISTLEAYVEEAKIVMGVLGHDVFKPISSTSETTTENKASTSAVLDFELRQGDVIASGQLTSEGFVVLKGSKVKKTVSPSTPKNAQSQREIYKDKIDADGVLTEDILLNSANVAAGFVTGNAIAGINFWKTADGKSLKEVQEIEAATL
jgi:hypothetical protein